MAGRSFFRRLLGNRSDAVGLDDVSTAPSPTDPTPIPYPYDDGPTAVAKSTSLDDLPDGTSQADFAGERVVADAEPTAFFDEAETLFSPRTDVPDAKEVAPTEPTPTVSASDGLRDGIVEMNGIIAPNNVVDDPEDAAPASPMTGSSA